MKRKKRKPDDFRFRDENIHNTRQRAIKDVLLSFSSQYDKRTNIKHMMSQPMLDCLLVRTMGKFLPFYIM